MCFQWGDHAIKSRSRCLVRCMCARCKHLGSECVRCQETHQVKAAWKERKVYSIEIVRIFLRSLRIFRYKNCKCFSSISQISSHGRIDIVSRRLTPLTLNIINMWWHNDNVKCLCIGRNLLRKSMSRIYCSVAKSICSNWACLKWLCPNMCCNYSLCHVNRVNPRRRCMGILSHTLRNTPIRQCGAIARRCSIEWPAPVRGWRLVMTSPRDIGQWKHAELSVTSIIL